MGWWGRFWARLFGKRESEWRASRPDEPPSSELPAWRATAVAIDRYPQDERASPAPDFTLSPSAASAPAAPAEYTYALRDDFLSRAEASFFHVLRAAVAADCLIFSKVRLADLVFPPRQEGQFGAWQRINRKHVDFVLCEPRTLRPLVALELDDRSHRRPDRLERDAFVDRVFADAGLPLVHVPARRSYDTRMVGALLDAALTGHPVATAPPVSGSAAPRCARCGGEMRLRTAEQGPRAGEQFWGCVNYPRCRQTVAVAAGVQHAGSA